ncbi:hypothetical protein ACFXPX_43090 [Kitasatospora sp. NPDC059146]|uniref:hypothetical protein n=1 Tax=unclassified Kitasatospora TaxID=2633591 RepID=UPI0036883A63
MKTPQEKQGHDEELQPHSAERARWADGERWVEPNSPTSHEAGIDDDVPEPPAADVAAP